MAGIGGSVQDELLRPTGSTNEFTETVTATGNGAAFYVGADRLVVFRLLVGGTVAGTNPTLDVKFQHSADGTSGWTDTGVAFSQVTASQATATGALAEPPRAAVYTPAGRPYLRVVKTVGGTNPSFGGVAVVLDPVYATSP